MPWESVDSHGPFRTTQWQPLHNSINLKRKRDLLAILRPSIKTHQNCMEIKCRKVLHAVLARKTLRTGNHLESLSNAYLLGRQLLTEGNDNKKNRQWWLNISKTWMTLLMRKQRLGWHIRLQEVETRHLRCLACLQMPYLILWQRHSGPTGNRIECD